MQPPPAAAGLGLWEGCLLGLLQGLTEFLPVSSSGHLAIAQHFLPGRSQDPVAVDVALHLGTLVAVLVYFARDLRGIARGAIDPAAGPSHARSWLGLIVLASVPGFITYETFGVRIEETFESLPVIGVNLMFTASVLAATGLVRAGSREESGMRAADALLIGMAQSLALLPGISRSGMTIAAGLLLGLRGEVAARFSFLMSIPAILGAEMVKLPVMLSVPREEAGAVLAGTIVAGLAGLVAIELLIRLVRGEKLRYFALYCGVLGALTVLKGLGGG
jgi:undecaprenyl-diphosphatase